MTWPWRETTAVGSCVALALVATYVDRLGHVWVTLVAVPFALCWVLLAPGGRYFQATWWALTSVMASSVFGVVVVGLLFGSGG